MKECVGLLVGWKRVWKVFWLVLKAKERGLEER